MKMTSARVTAMKMFFSYTLFAPSLASAEGIRDSGSIPTLGGAACNLIYSPSDATWRINKFGLDENLNESTTLFSTQSNASIQSVACEVSGANVYFSYQAYDGDDFEIYQLALNEEGASPVPLTDNTVDDTNVTISGDGAVLAWQTELNDGRQAVEILERFEDGSTETRTLSSANHYLQPSLSQNGEWLSLVQRRSGADLVWKYHLADAAFTRISTVPRHKRAHNPSINNDGDKIAWVEGKGKNVLILYTVGASPAREAIITNANGIGHPFLADNGSMVIYSVYRNRKGLTYVYDMEKDQQYRLADTLRREVYTSSTWYTEGSRDKCTFLPVVLKEHSSGKLSRDIDFSGFEPTCVSKRLTENGDHYSKFFTLNLESDRSVSISGFAVWSSWGGSSAAHLIISEGADGKGRVVASIYDDRNDEYTSRTLNTLQAGQYTIEVSRVDRFDNSGPNFLRVETFDSDYVENCPATDLAVYNNDPRTPEITINRALSTWQPDAYDVCNNTRYYIFYKKTGLPIRVNTLLTDADGETFTPVVKLYTSEENGYEVITEGSGEILSPAIPADRYIIAVDAGESNTSQMTLSLDIGVLDEI